MARLTIVADKVAMSEAAAERMTSLVGSAIAARGLAALTLCGGSSPDLLYEFLGDPNRPWRRRIDWSHLHLFWADEREVGPDHPESNFGLAQRLLIQHVPVPETQVHRMRGELPASDAGRLYDAVLRARRDQTVGPLFDIVLLGVGANAHIASIFPNSPLLMPERDQLLATGVAVPELSQWRITMTPAALLDSAVILVIASGASKAEAVAAAIEGPLDVARYPAQLLREPGERVEWIVDATAARLL